MKNKLIYLASPYTAGSKKAQAERYEAACIVTAKLIKDGLFVFSPIVHSHHLVKYGLDGDWEFWSDMDKIMIDKCDMMYVLMLNGWHESVGVDAEIHYAISKFKEVKYLNVNGEIQ